MKINEIYAISGLLSATILLIWSFFFGRSDEKAKIKGKTLRDMAIFVCLFSFKEFFIPDLGKYDWKQTDLDVIFVITMSYICTFYFLATIGFHNFEISLPKNRKKKKGDKKKKFYTKLIFFYLIMFCLSGLLAVYSSYRLLQENNVIINDFW